MKATYPLPDSARGTFFFLERIYPADCPSGLGGKVHSNIFTAQNVCSDFHFRKGNPVFLAGAVENKSEHYPDAKTGKRCSANERRGAWDKKKYDAQHGGYGSDGATKQFEGLVGNVNTAIDDAAGGQAGKEIANASTDGAHINRPGDGRTASEWCQERDDDDKEHCIVRGMVLGMNFAKPFGKDRSPFL